MTDVPEDVLAVEPESESEIPFRGQKIKAATMKNKQGYVSVRSMCEAFGLNNAGQQQRILRTKLFKDQMLMVKMSSPYAGGKGTRRQAQMCLSAFVVPAFLMGVETNMVSDPETKAMLDAFQEEGMIVLAEHFGLSERGEIRFLRETITKMAIQQQEFEEQVVLNVEKELAADRQAREEKIQQIRDAFGKMREQIRTLEKTAGPKARITPEHMGQIRHTVMVLGELMIMCGEKTKPWAGIYTSITLQFGVSRTEDLPQEAMPEVLEFLDRQVYAFRTLYLKQTKNQ